MKILQVNKFLRPVGGSETYMYGLSEKLEAMGHKVEYFGMEHPDNTVGNHLNLNVANMDFHDVSGLEKVLMPLKIIYSSDARKKMARLLLKFKPDVVHINNYNFQLTPSILYACRDMKVPVVVTLHDFQIVCPNHMMYRESEGLVCEACKGRAYQSCVKYNCIHDSKVRSILGAAEGFIYNKLGTYDKYVNRFIAPSQFLADKVVEFGEKPEKIVRLHNFITELDTSKTFEKKDYVLYFGRLSKQKGINTLIEVMKKNPEINFKIAGGGDMVEDIKKVPNADYLGFVTGDDLVNLIGEALFSVYPSEWYENCPMSVLESQMYGTPVIGSHIGGIPELIDHQIDGLLFEPGNVTEFSDMVANLYNNRVLLKFYSMKCRQKVQKFSIDDYYDDIMKVYEDVVAEKKGKK